MTHRFRLVTRPALVSLFTAATAILAVPQAAQAQVTVSLTPATQSATPNSTVFYTATVTNFSSSAAYLNGVGFSIDPASSAFINGNDASFFANVPATLAAAGSAGDSYSGILFGVDVNANATNTSYFGSVSLFGSTDPADPNALNLLGAPQNFIVSVTGASTTPEPGSAALLFGGVASVGSVAFFRRRPVK